MRPSPLGTPIRDRHPPAECVAYADCDADYPVVWCVYQDGHNWPDFAPEGIWNFFKSLR